MRVVLAAAMLLVVARLIDVQVIHSGKYQTAALNESHEEVTLDSLRGGIYSRDGSPLALSVPTDNVIADDFQIAHPGRTAAALSPLLGIPATTLASELHRHSGYVVLASQLSQADGEKIAADAIPGITLVAGSKRVVTNGNLASPVLGYTNGSNSGAGGIEYAYNRKLAGTAGKETLIESPSGVALPESTVDDQVASKPGQGLELTLDTQLQYESEQALAQAIESSQALSGTAILMDVKTGQILSMANLVSTHPTAPVSATPPTVASTAGGAIPIGPKDAVNEATNNTAVTQLYEPGSVFKLVTFSAALQDGLINPNTEFTVPDQINLDGSTFHDADPHPTEQAHRHPDPGPVVQHRDVGDRRGAGGAAPAGPGEEPGLRQVHRTRFPGGVARTDRHGGPVGADRLRVAAHRAGGRRQRPPGPRCVQRGGQRGHIRAAQAGGGHRRPVGRRHGDRALADPPRLLAPDRLRADHHARAGGLGRDGHERRGAGLHRGRQDRHGADPDHGQGCLYRGCVHGLVRRASPPR